MQYAVKKYIASQKLARTLYETWREVFMKLDENDDGELSLEEL